MTLLAKSATFIENFRCFKKGDTFELHELTLLVGDQGCGKSSLIEAMLELNVRSKKVFIETVTGEPVTRWAHDFEKDNPRIKGRIETKAQIAMAWSSHGEVVRMMLERSLQDAASRGEKNLVWIWDEPDTAMSPRSCYKLRKIMDQSIAVGHQIIAAVHNPILIQDRDVLSLEHRRWMSGDEFLKLHRENN